MIATIIISSLTFILVILSILFYPKIKISQTKSIDTYWIISLIGAILLLTFRFAPIREVYSELTTSAPVNPIKILILFFSMTIISVLLDEFGFFRYLASVATRKAKSSQYLLFFLLYGLTSLLTIFTSNDVVILTLTPFICFFAKNAKINPLPYLIAEFSAANTWSLFFLIGNPTNIYLATSAGINFLDYFKVMWLPTLLGGLTELVIIFLIFRKKLKEPMKINEDDYSLPSKLDLVVGLIHLLICLVFLIISSYISIEMLLVSFICALSLLVWTLVIRLVSKKHWDFISNSLKRLPYPLIPFFLSMFVVVVALNYQGISHEIASLFGNKNTICVYGYTSYLFSNLMNNIPMSIFFTNLTTELRNTASYLPSVYASIIGSNIGAFLTPIGALAGMMFSRLVSEHEIKLSFFDFVKYGFVISIPTITMSLIGLFIMIG